MKPFLRILPLLLVPAIASCGSDNASPPTERPALHPAQVNIAQRFGGAEVKNSLSALGALGGRLLTETGVRLLGSESRLLIDLDLSGSRPESLVEIPLRGLEPGTELAGLAAAPDGSLWTVRDRTSLVRIDATGLVVETTALPFDAYDLYGWRGQLLAQVAHTGGGETPFMSRSATESWNSVSPLRTRERSSGTDALTWNLAHCGASRADLLPCWFLVGDPEVVLVNAEGSWTSCPVQLFANAGGGVRVGDKTYYPLNFRDLFVSEQREIIALADTGEGDDARGLFLARYSLAGSALGGYRLTQGARKILDARNGTVTLLLLDHGIGKVALT